jgi:hypothetical protein
MFKTARHSTVDSLLDAFSKCPAIADLDGYFGCFFSADSVFLGTDASEHWTAAEFIEYAKPHFNGESAWVYNLIEGSRKLHTVENKVTAFDELLQSESFSTTARGSGSAIFDSETNCWFIISYHLSFPIPNAIAKPICSRLFTYAKEVQLATNQSAAIIASELAAQALMRELDDEEATANLKNKSQGKNAGKGKGNKNK